MRAPTGRPASCRYAQLRNNNQGIVKLASEMLKKPEGPPSFIAKETLTGAVLDAQVCCRAAPAFCC